MCPSVKIFFLSAVICIGVSLSSCNGILSGVYDEPGDPEKSTVSGQLYIDASSWTDWYYIDLQAVAEAVEADPDYNTSSAWVSYPVPTAPLDNAPTDTKNGIYTYWYDVYGAGIGKHEFRSFYPTAAQQEPERWTFAVHRNNVRTNGGAVAATGLRSIDLVPTDPAELAALTYVEDTWNETDSWTIQDQMLLGLIGNQGIMLNSVMAGWLTMQLPPIPPSFTMDNQVFVLRLADGTYAALQLHNYISDAGVKCCLTINYKYPL